MFSKKRTTLVCSCTKVVAVLGAAVRCGAVGDDHFVVSTCRGHRTARVAARSRKILVNPYLGTTVVNVFQAVAANVEQGARFCKAFGARFGPRGNEPAATISWNDGVLRRPLAPRRAL
jgi:hypothetical protein